MKKEPEHLKKLRKILSYQVVFLFCLTIVFLVTGFYPAIVETLFMYSLGGLYGLAVKGIKIPLLMAISVGLLGGFLDPFIAPYLPFPVPSELAFSLIMNFLFGTTPILFGWSVMRLIIMRGWK